MFSLNSDESWVGQSVLQCSAISSQGCAETWHCCLGPKQFPLLTVMWFINHSTHNHFNTKPYTMQLTIHLVILQLIVWTKRLRRSRLLLYLLQSNRTWMPNNESLPVTVETQRGEHLPTRLTKCKTDGVWEIHIFKSKTKQNKTEKGTGRIQ